MVTTEVRYFFKGELNDGWKTAIHHFNMVPQDTRKDHYFRNEASTIFGVKWREGNLEIKGLVDKVEHGGMIMENWEKNIISSGVAEDKTGNWLTVTKQRWLQFFDNLLLPLNELPQEEMLYCQVEISEIEVMGKTYHSFCLECGGSSSETRAALLFRCLQMLVEELPELARTLNTKRACSYPLFLRDHTNCT